jgi:hypothetical protein
MTTKTGNIYLTTGQSAAQATLLFNPQWLYETHQRSDFMHGLDEWSIYGVRGVDVVDSESGAKVLSLRRADKEFPAAAVWNFPAGRKGTLKLSLQLKPGFKAADISVTDHYSTPYDLEAELYALYRLHIPANARIGKIQLQPGRWYDIVIQWDAAQNEAIVLVDGARAVTVPQQHPTDGGANYLRLRATSDDTSDTGFLVKSVEADVSGKNPSSTVANLK